MERKQHGEAPYEEPFPYKTYDEIQLEKIRRVRFRQIMVVVAGVFLLFSTVIVGISLIWRSTTNQFPAGESLSPGSAGPEAGSDLPAEDPGPSQAEVRQSQSLLEESRGIYVTDVSGAVKKARAFVAAVRAEDYSTREGRSGSGIVLSENGYVLTGRCFLEGCDSITVTLDGGETYAAFIVGSDECSGLAVLKIGAHGLTALKPADLSAVEPGQAAIAMGGGTEDGRGSVTFGVVSGINRSLTVGTTLMDLIQTDAAIHSGNAGGPLLDQRGEVLGVNADWISVYGMEGQGFAICIDEARAIAASLIQNGQVAGRPCLGILGTDTAPAAQGMNLPRGILVSAVEAGSGAALAGLKEGDVITELGDRPITSLEEGYLAREQYRAGDWLKVTYSRVGALKTVELRLGDQLEAGESNF